MDEASIKLCKDCGEEKMLTEFHKNSKMKDGYLGQCKDCRKSSRNPQRYIRLYELAPKEREKRRAGRREYYKNKTISFQERQRRNLAAQRNVVYSVRNVYNGKEYIGSTTTYRHRISGHKSQLRRGVHRSKDIQKDYDLCGLAAFEFNVLYEMSNEEYTELVLREKETEIIKSISISGGTLYNNTYVVKDWSHGKRCPCCGEHKPRSAYHTSSRANSGLTAYCKECASIKAKIRYITQKAKRENK